MCWRCHPSILFTPDLTSATTTRQVFISLHLLLLSFCFSGYEITCKVSAARLRSKTPSEDWARRSTNFFVNRPREVSYRVFSGGDLGAIVEERGDKQRNKMTTYVSGRFDKVLCFISLAKNSISTVSIWKQDAQINFGLIHEINSMTGLLYSPWYIFWTAFVGFWQLKH